MTCSDADTLSLLNEIGSDEHPLFQASCEWDDHGIARQVSLDNDLASFTSDCDQCIDDDFNIEDAFLWHDQGHLAMEGKLTANESVQCHGQDNIFHVFGDTESSSTNTCPRRVKNTCEGACNGDLTSRERDNRGGPTDRTPHHGNFPPSPKQTNKVHTIQSLPQERCTKDQSKDVSNIPSSKEVSANKKCASTKARKNSAKYGKSKSSPGIKKPKRPLSAFNFFFSYERSKVLGSPLNDISVQKGTKRRRHRKTHGKIAFTDLAKLISQRWKEIDTADFSFYEAKAAEDLVRYRKEMDTYKAQVDAKKETDKSVVSANESPDAGHLASSPEKSSSLRKVTSLNSSIEISNALKDAFAEKRKMEANIRRVIAKQAEAGGKSTGLSFHASTETVGSFPQPPCTAPRHGSEQQDSLTHDMKKFLGEDVLPILGNLDKLKSSSLVSKKPHCQLLPGKAMPVQRLDIPPFEFDIEPIPFIWN